MNNAPIPAGTYIGHVHLKVADMERSIRFYCDVLGFKLVSNMGTITFVTAGDYHHRIAFNTWESKDGHPPAPGTTGLFHFAINYPTRRDLALTYKRLLDQGWPIDNTRDHTSHEAIYIHDPDFNGIELVSDRDPSYWNVWQGVTMEDMMRLNKPLDIAGLLAELDKPEPEAVEASNT